MNLKIYLKSNLFCEALQWMLSYIVNNWYVGYDVSLNCQFNVLKDDMQELATHCLIKLTYFHC